MRQPQASTLLQLPVGLQPKQEVRVKVRIEYVILENAALIFKRAN